MDTSGLTGLLNNAAILIALGVIYDTLGLHAIVNKYKRNVLSGVLVGLLGLAVMNTAWEMAPGLIFDTRWVLISICGLFFGFIPTLIAATMMVTLRLYIGGVGAGVGSLVIILPACIGLAWRYLSRYFNQPHNWIRLYLFGLIIQFTVLSCLLLMAESVRFKIIEAVWFPLVAIYPIGTMLLGLILRRQSERRRAEIDLKQSQSLLAREKSQLRGLVNAIPDQISFKDTSGRFMGCNYAFEQYAGVSESEIIGKTSQAIFKVTGEGHSDDNLFSTSENSQFEEWITYPDGKKVLHETMKTVFHDMKGDLQGLVRISRDITERKNAEKQIRDLAFYDPLTKLPNRRMLLDRLQVMISASSRSNHYGALYFIDLDHFKKLNDTQGHTVGDQLLISVASRLKSCLREEDSIARFGGDEFVATIANLGSDKERAAVMAESVAEKMRKLLCEPYPLIISSNNEKTILFHSTPSIGISLFRDDLGSRDEFIKQADVAMYQSKESGRNAIRFFDPVMQATLEQNTTLQADLHDAISRNEFELYYQVQVDENHGILGAEVLIRWHHPTRGLVPPLEFIPLAEESGLIIPIGGWVLNNACQQLKAWEDIPGRINWQIAVNVSALQFQQESFVSEIQEAISAHGINPSLLKLELTESLVLVDIEQTIIKMKALNKFGINFSMDDFGTGQSSLSNLKRLPLKQLKIDQSFVRDITSDSDDAAIIQMIINLSSSLKYDVIAEGVETDAQRLFLYDNGCSQYQGYLFSRPLPHSEFEILVSSGSLEINQLSEPVLQIQ